MLYPTELRAQLLNNAPEIQDSRAWMDIRRRLRMAETTVCKADLIPIIENVFRTNTDREQVDSLKPEVVKVLSVAMLRLFG